MPSNRLSRIDAAGTPMPRWARNTAAPTAFDKSAFAGHIGAGQKKEIALPGPVAHHRTTAAAAEDDKAASDFNRKEIPCPGSQETPDCIFSAAMAMEYQASSLP